MKIIYLLLLCFITTPLVTAAQCPSGSVSFRSQSDMDAFKINYPNCTAINGSVIIGDVENMSGLSNLISISGNFEVNFNHYLLRNLDGMENLTYIGGTLSMYHALGVNNVQGLKNLKSVNKIFIFYSGLSNFKGLENITSLPGGLSIDETSISSLSGLENVVNSKYFYIRRNNNLRDCAITPVCNFFSTTHLPGSGEYMYISGGGNCTNALLAKACDPLPVTLKTLEVRKEGDVVNVKWETSSEVNSKLFEVQHSVDGKFWNMIGAVPSVGESNAENEYTFQHKNPSAANNYYRLKMIDKDNSFAYSSISYVYFKSALIAEIYPNPVSDILKIKVADWESVRTIELINSERSVIYRSRNTPSKDIDVSQVKSGIHVLKITRKDRTETVHKVVVAR